MGREPGQNGGCGLHLNLDRLRQPHLGVQPDIGGIPLADAWNADGQGVGRVDDGGGGPQRRPQQPRPEQLRHKGSTAPFTGLGELGGELA